MTAVELKEGINRALKVVSEMKETNIGNCFAIDDAFSTYGYVSPIHHVYQEYCKEMGDDVLGQANWHDIYLDDGKKDFEATYERRVERLNGFRDWLIANKKYEGL